MDQATNFLTCITERSISNIGHKNRVIIEDYNDFPQTLRPISRPIDQMFFLALSCSQFTTAVPSMKPIQVRYLIYLKFEYQKPATAKHHVFLYGPQIISTITL